MEPFLQDRIVNEEYADLLIAYSGDMSVFDVFEDATVNVINFFHAVVHIPVVRITDNIIRELGYRVMPSLFGLITESALEASGILRLRNIPALNLRGHGVLIGLIDTGIDYTNPIFRYADGTTKIVSIWDQSISSGVSPVGLNYGSQYSREEINSALASPNPYEIVPSIDTIGHGTMLAGIAAGNEVPEQGFYGIVPDAELVVVKLKQAKTYLTDFFRVPRTVPCYQENDILFGLQYIMDISNRLNRPIAVCIALGTSQGAHDGMGTLSNYISLLAERAGVAMVVAAGNEGNARRHYRGIVDPLVGYDEVELIIGENEGGFSMELWGDSPNVYSVDIVTPSGEYIPRLAARLDENMEVSFVFEQTVIYIDYQMVEAQSGEQLILFRFTNPDPGIWRFRIYGRGDLRQGFHIWLPMQGFISENTYFVRSDPYTTILSLGNATIPITATAYNYLDNTLYGAASRGFTRIGIPKPDIAAPGVQLLAPDLRQDFTLVTGTSPCAAFTTGVAAMLLEWGITRGYFRFMSTVHVKVFMQRGALRNTEMMYPNADWGYGILDVFQIFDVIRGQ